MLLTQQQISKCYTNLSDSTVWLNILNNLLPAYDIVSPEQVAMFLAQIGHESYDLTRLEENLKYSKDGLIMVFPHYFSEETATMYAKKPEAIANIVYANRMGNGSPDSGDGYKYRGRGSIQLTGFTNYLECSNFWYKNDYYVKNPDALSTNKEDAIKAGVWFWYVNKLHTYSDIVTITKKINKGVQGLTDRLNRYTKYLEILKV